MSKSSRILLLPVLLMMHSTIMAKGLGHWVDAASLSIGKDGDPDKTNVYRIGFQNKWERSWFNGGAWFLSGYWDAELGQVESDTSPGNDLIDISVTPVFRYQRDADLSSGVTPYAEAGIGAHLLSETHIGNNSLSTAFQFSPMIGIGVGFGERGKYELSYRFQQFTNANIKEPNDGLELHLLRLGYNFH